MHSVTRPDKPKSLVDNADTWKKDLMNQIVLKGSYEKVDKIYKNKYKQDDVGDELEKMYSNLCCFCESRLGIQTYQRIEHLKPKSKFPELSFEWDNLNLVCEICNTSYKKGKDELINNLNSLKPLLDYPTTLQTVLDNLSK